MYFDFSGNVTDRSDRGNRGWYGRVVSDLGGARGAIASYQRRTTAQLLDRQLVLAWTECRLFELFFNYFFGCQCDHSVAHEINTREYDCCSGELTRGGGLAEHNP